jgi:hypothetical protein
MSDKIKKRKKTENYASIVNTGQHRYHLSHLSSRTFSSGGSKGQGKVVADNTPGET